MDNRYNGLTAARFERQAHWQFGGWRSPAAAGRSRCSTHLWRPHPACPDGEADGGLATNRTPPSGRAGWGRHHMPSIMLAIHLGSIRTRRMRAEMEQRGRATRLMHARCLNCIFCIEACGPHVVSPWAEWSCVECIRPGILHLCTCMRLARTGRH